MLKTIDKYIKSVKEVIEDHVRQGLSGEVEFIENIGDKELCTYAERDAVCVYVYDFDGEELTRRFGNVVRYVKKQLKNAVREAEQAEETGDSQDDYEVFGGYAMRGSTVTSRWIHQY